MMDGELGKIKEALGTVSLLRLQPSAAPGALRAFRPWAEPRRRRRSALTWGGCALWTVFKRHPILLIHSTVWRLTRTHLWAQSRTRSSLETRTSRLFRKNVWSRESCLLTQCFQLSRSPSVCRKIRIQKRRSSGSDPRYQCARFYCQLVHACASC